MPPRERALRIAAVLLCAAVLARFAVGCARIAAYPWDWDPGEGMFIDYAVRVLHAPRTLYPADTVVPYPLVYTPLLPAVLAPVVAIWGAALPAARLVSCAFALLALAAAFTLGRRAGGPLGGLLAAALLAAPVGHSFWLVMLRADSPLIALWLCAAAVILPERLERGFAKLGWPRALAGATLLVLCVLAKPTGALLGAPLVLGWLLVDVRSSARLGAATLLLGAAAFAALEIATSGGFWRCLSLQLVHPRISDQRGRLLAGWTLRQGATLLLGAAALLWRARQKEHPLRDGATLLWLAGPVSLPLLDTSGAMFAYLLPWGCGQAVLVARWLGRNPMAQLAGSLLALAVASIQILPRPSPADELTARSLYAFALERGPPLLSTSTAYAYPLVGQPMEVEATSFAPFAAARLPGIEGVLDRVRAARYRTLIERTDAGRISTHAYSPAGRCEMGYFFGTAVLTLFVPGPARFVPAEGSRCAVLQPVR
jgi:hypothetical protein